VLRGLVTGALSGEEVLWWEEVIQEGLVDGYRALSARAGGEPWGLSGAYELFHGP